MNFDEDNNKIGKCLQIHNYKTLNRVANNLTQQECLSDMNMALRLVPNTEKPITNVTQVGKEKKIKFNVKSSLLHYLIFEYSLFLN